MSLNIQSRQKPIRALSFPKTQPLFLSPLSLLLISSDNSHSANSLVSSRIISLQTAAEEIEIISSWLIEPMIASTRDTSAAARRRCWGLAEGGCLMCRRTEERGWETWFGLSSTNRICSIYNSQPGLKEESISESESFSYDYRLVFMEWRLSRS